MNEYLLNTVLSILVIIISFILAALQAIAYSDVLFVAQILLVVVASIIVFTTLISPFLKNN